MTSTTRNTLVGLGLGVATGLFLGEKAGGFQLVEEAYLRFLQMTVLPYVMVSLIEGIGSLDGARARRDLEFARFLGIWIDLQRKNGTIRALYDHWILGRDARPKQPRSPVIRNVLHWVN